MIELGYTWLMKPSETSETEVTEIVAIVKHQSCRKCRLQVKKFEERMKLLSDPNLVRGFTYLTILESIRTLLFGIFRIKMAFLHRKVAKIGQATRARGEKSQRR